MTTTTIASVLTIACLACAAAYGAEQFGVPVYPGATLHKPSAEMFKQNSMEGGCYRTADAMAKVVAFYKKRPELKPIASVGAVAKFEMKGGADAGGVDVTIQSPWMDVAARQLVQQGSLVCIGKQAK